MGQIQTRKKRHDNIKKVLHFESNEKYFIRNGASLLEHQVRISESQDIVARELKIFSNKEIEKATNNYYDERAINFRFDMPEQINIFKAILDNDIVASVFVPTSTSTPNPNLRNTMINGVSTITIMNHRNIVKVYGCCLETSIPMVVCEYIQNGSVLFEHLQSDNSLQWNDYMRVMTEIAYALSYIHNAFRKPLVHREVSSFSIFVDSTNHAKLWGFGKAVSITLGDGSQKYPIIGTIGYIDPEYIETQRITDKCDVYSFGVLIIELLTRRQPLVMAINGTNLVDVFVCAVNENRIKDMIHSKVVEQACWNQILWVVQLALACVAPKGINRPIMIDVVDELWKIQGRNNM